MFHFVVEKREKREKACHFDADCRPLARPIASEFWNLPERDTTGN